MRQHTAGATPGKNRIFEIDALRGVAILLMVVFHLVFDLNVYFGLPVRYYTGFWFWVGRVSAISFMVISGVSSTLGGRTLRRGFMVLAAGMLVTVASIPVMGENYIRFGILHFFGSVMILKGLYEKIVKNRTARFVTALALIPLCFWLGRAVQMVYIDTFLLLPLGIVYPGFTSFDYYPLLLWGGWFCAGIALGMLVYKGKQSLFRFNPAAPGTAFPARVLAGTLRPLIFLGRHSLAVYVLHQPLVLGILYLLHFAGLL